MGMKVSIFLYQAPDAESGILINKSTVWQERM